LRLPARTKTVELCDYGPVEIGPDSTGLYPPAVEEGARRVLLLVADALADDADAGRRATAGYLRAILDGISAQDAIRASNRDCKADPACVESLQIAGTEKRREAAERLAADVAGTRDGRAYAMAWYLCGKTESGIEWTGSCALVSAARWAQAEPDNVIPWSAEANRARAVDDQAALEAAMVGATATTTSKLYLDGLSEFVEHPLLEKADRATQLAALTQLVGMRAALQLPLPVAIQHQCRADGQLSEERRRQCGAIAAALARGSTSIELVVSGSLGKAAGWTDEQLASLRDQIDAIHALSIARLPARDFFSCKYFAALKQAMSDDARRGEVGMVDAEIERSGRSAKEIAAQYRAALRTKAGR